LRPSYWGFRAKNLRRFALDHRALEKIRIRRTPHSGRVGEREVAELVITVQACCCSVAGIAARPPNPHGSPSANSYRLPSAKSASVTLASKPQSRRSPLDKERERDRKSVEADHLLHQHHRFAADKGYANLENPNDFGNFLSALAA